LIGYGNPGRLDDGLGPAFAGAVEGMRQEGVTVDANYQLAVEDAAAIAEHDAVLFADAAVEGPEPFFLRRVKPVRALSFSSHSLEPPAVLALAREMFGATTRGYALGIRGYEFNEFGENLSKQARANLAAALEALGPALTEDGLERLAARFEDDGEAPAPPQEETP
jgi:hydrogenase maturation protease